MTDIMTVEDFQALMAGTDTEILECSEPIVLVHSTEFRHWTSAEDLEFMSSLPEVPDEGSMLDVEPDPDPPSQVLKCESRLFDSIEEVRDFFIGKRFFYYAIGTAHAAVQREDRGDDARIHLRFAEWMPKGTPRSMKRLLRKTETFWHEEPTSDGEYPRSEEIAHLR